MNSADQSGLSVSLADLRREYTLAGLTRRDLDPDPLRQFQKWLEQAVAAQVPEPRAMVLATIDPAGQPSTRLMMLKAVDARGFVFCTHAESRKAAELSRNPHAALNFLWLELERQVCVAGQVNALSREEAERYFRERSRRSQLVAWAGKQSELLPPKPTLEERIRELEGRFAGMPVPTPPSWTAYLLCVRQIEFWQGRPNRLHDRFRYVRQPGDAWAIERLAP